jgi:hypothetical protein
MASRWVRSLIKPLVSYMSRSRLFYDHIDGSVLLSFSCSDFALLNYLCAVSFFFPFGDANGNY